MSLHLLFDRINAQGSGREKGRRGKRSVLFIGPLSASPSQNFEHFDQQLYVFKVYQVYKANLILKLYELFSYPLIRV